MQQMVLHLLPINLQLNKVILQMLPKTLVVQEQIKLLEQELDIQLFRRSGRSAEPTDAARHLMQRIKPHMAAIEQALAETRENANQQSLARKEAI